MSLARQHRARTLALQAASAPALGSGLAAPVSTARLDPADAAAGQMRLRLRHDRQRLKQIMATELKVAAKREMLPEYRAWCDGVLEAGRMTVGHDLPPGPAPEVLPTIMIWSIDIGDWPRALEIAAHVLRFDVPLPDHYKRTAGTLIVEEIAEAALAAQLAGRDFPIEVLEDVDELTCGLDMHDEVRAKLCKALGVELARAADRVETGAADFITAATRAIEPLRRAQALHARAGTKTKVAQLERAIKAAVAQSTPDVAPVSADAQEN